MISREILGILGIFFRYIGIPLPPLADPVSSAPETIRKIFVHDAGPRSNTQDAPMRFEWQHFFVSALFIEDG